MTQFTIFFTYQLNKNFISKKLITNNFFNEFYNKLNIINSLLTPINFSTINLLIIFKHIFSQFILFSLLKINTNLLLYLTIFTNNIILYLLKLKLLFKNLLYHKILNNIYYFYIYLISIYYYIFSNNSNKIPKSFYLLIFNKLKINKNITLLYDNNFLLYNLKKNLIISKINLLSLNNSIFSTIKINNIILKNYYIFLLKLKLHYKDFKKLIYLKKKNYILNKFRNNLILKLFKLNYYLLIKHYINISINLNSKRFYFIFKN